MDEYRKTVLSLLEHESSGIIALQEQADEIIRAAEICASCRGRIIVTGLGKSGIVARKIASTLTSIGASAVFLHPTEALHGDLGILSENDVTICISKSGHTEELEFLLSYFKRWGLPIISITAERNSSLSEQSDVAIILPTSEEGEPLGIIPTTSVITSIAVGDAIVAVLVKMLEITKERFRKFHPGGSLGHRLTKVSELMHTGDEIPVVSPDATLRDAIVEITRKKLGTTLVMKGEKLVGILTDGDVRRAIQRTDIENPLDENVMTFAATSPKSIHPDALAEEALHIMESNAITSLVILKGNLVVGFLHIH
ncbi:hypothetical protein DRQ26_06630, partial [bacterium]